MVRKTREEKKRQTKTKIKILYKTDTRNYTGKSGSVETGMENIGGGHY